MPYHFTHLICLVVFLLFHQQQVLPIPTAVDRRNLFFNVITNREGNQTVTVEGAGVNATLIQADIAQVNGYVHIIDRVLGVPFATVYDKLRTDPMLKWVAENPIFDGLTLGQLCLDTSEKRNQHSFLHIISFYLSISSFNGIFMMAARIYASVTRIKDLLDWAPITLRFLSYSACNVWVCVCQRL